MTPLNVVCAALSFDLTFGAPNKEAPTLVFKNILSRLMPVIQMHRLGLAPPYWSVSERMNVGQMKHNAVEPCEALALGPQHPSSPNYVTICKVYIIQEP